MDIHTQQYLLQYTVGSLGVHIYISLYIAQVLTVCSGRVITFAIHKSLRQNISSHNRNTDPILHILFTYLLMFPLLFFYRLALCRQDSQDFICCMPSVSTLRCLRHSEELHLSCCLLSNYFERVLPFSFPHQFCS